MPCFHPLTGWRSKSVNPSGKRGITFKREEGFPELEVQIPCGHCWGCRLERSRQWAMRCVHESTMHEKSCFITLTYDNEHLPKDGSLQLDHFQQFFKRLRKKYTPKCPYKKGHPEREKWLKENNIRFFHCGEYGEKFGRPHYHAIIWGLDFPDKTFFKTSSSGSSLYISKSLGSLWPYGFHTIGEVTFESAAYVARYVMKKKTGNHSFVAVDPFTGKKRQYENSLEYYESVDMETGEVTYRRPEYTTMSRRPGIGDGWYQKYKNDVFPHDYVVMRGKKMKVPKYYNTKYELEYPEDYAKLKQRRKIKALRRVLTQSQLEALEVVKMKQTSKLIRHYEQNEGFLIEGHENGTVRESQLHKN